MFLTLRFTIVLFLWILLLDINTTGGYYKVNALACIQSNDTDTTCTNANGTCTDSGFCLYNATTNTCNAVDKSIGNCADIGITNIIDEDDEDDDVSAEPSMFGTIDDTVCAQCGNTCTLLDDDGTAGICQSDDVTCAEITDDVPPPKCPIGSPCTSNDGCISKSCKQVYMPPNFPTLCFCNSEENLGCPENMICRHLTMVIPDSTPTCYKPINTPCDSNTDDNKCETQYCNPKTNTCDCNVNFADFNIPACIGFDVNKTTSTPTITSSLSPTITLTSTPTVTPVIPDHVVQWEFDNEPRNTINNVNVGDIIKFQWDENLHNLYIHTSGTCDDDSSIELVSNSFNTLYYYTVRSADEGKEITFVCTLPNHCTSGNMLQRIQVNGPPIDDTVSPTTIAPSKSIILPTTGTPTKVPTKEPTEVPTDIILPTISPTVYPTDSPTETPNDDTPNTENPTGPPDVFPTINPTDPPIVVDTPTEMPTGPPDVFPTINPTDKPVVAPIVITDEPTDAEPTTNTAAPVDATLPTTPTSSDTSEPTTIAPTTLLPPSPPTTATTTSPTTTSNETTTPPSPNNTSSPSPVPTTNTTITQSSSIPTTTTNSSLSSYTPSISPLPTSMPSTPPPTPTPLPTPVISAATTTTTTTISSMFFAVIFTIVVTTTTALSFVC